MEFTDRELEVYKKLYSSVVNIPRHEYRDITDLYRSDKLYSLIGTDKIHTGDYFYTSEIIKDDYLIDNTGTNLIQVYGVNYYLGRSVRKPHLICGPATSFGSDRMNPTYTNKGGYLNSYMNRKILSSHGSISEKLSREFENHLTYFCIEYGINCPIVISLLSRYQIFDTDCNLQFPLFKYRPETISIGNEYWLRDTSILGFFTSNHGALASESSDKVCYIRPYFIIS